MTAPTLERESVPGSTPTDVSVDDAVANGVAFLDERYGRDVWLRRVDLESLDVRSQLDCVLAQVTGHTFTTALDVVGAPSGGSFTRTRWSDAHGFSRDIMGENNWDSCARYRQLTAAWASKITELRAEVNA